MTQQASLETPGLTLCNTVASLALRRVRGRIVGFDRDGGAAVHCFLDDDPAVVREALVRAVRLSFLAIEIALRGRPVWLRIAAEMSRELGEAFLAQTQNLRDVLIRAGLGGEAPDAVFDVARSLGDLRRTGGFRLSIDDRARQLAIDSNGEDADSEAAQIEPALEGLKRAGHAPMIDLLLLGPRHGELLAVGLVDYFLCRGLQADPVLGGDFVYVHLHQLDELWSDDIAVLARALEQQLDKIEAAIDGDNKIGGASDDAANTALERLFERGLDCYLAADYANAVVHFTSALRHDPENFPLLSYRGDAYRLLCDYDRALADYSAALQVDPASAPVLVQRAMVHQQRGDAQQAIADADAAIALDGNYAAAYLARAEAKVASSLYEQAAADFTVACQKQPENLWAFFGRGKAQLANKHFAAAIDDFNQVLRLNPHYVPALLHRADARRERGNFGQAILDYTEVIRVHPRNQAAYRGRALACERRGEFERAIDDYDLALQLDPRDAVSLCRRGSIYRRQNNLKRASADLDEAIRCAPDHAAAHYQRGLLHLSRGQCAEALTDMNEAVSRDPGMLNAYLGRALVYDRLAQYAEGIQSCGRALQLNPKSAAAHLVRGVISSHAGHYAKAIADLSSAIALDAKLPLAYQERGLAHLLTGDYERAFNDFTRLIRMDPNHATAYATRGTVRQLLGEQEGSLADFRQALQLDPKSMLTGLHGSLAEQARNRTTQLLTDYVEGIRPQVEAARVRHENAERPVTSRPAAQPEGPTTPIPSKQAGSVVRVRKGRQTTTSLRPLAQSPAPSDASPRQPHQPGQNGKAAATMIAVPVQETPGQADVEAIAEKDVEVLEDFVPATEPETTPTTIPRQEETDPSFEACAAPSVDAEAAAVFSAEPAATATEEASAPTAAPPEETTVFETTTEEPPVPEKEAEPLDEEVLARRRELALQQAGDRKAKHDELLRLQAEDKRKKEEAEKRLKEKQKLKKKTDDDDDPDRVPHWKKGLLAVAAATALWFAGSWVMSLYADYAARAPITLRRMFEDFAADAEQARRKYDGGIFELSGKARFVKTPKGTRLAIESPQMPNWAVHCQFEMAPKIYKQLIADAIQPGQEITVTGRCSYQPLEGKGVILMEECELRSKS